MAAAEDKKEYKDAYLDALSISPIDRDVLKYLHKINDNTLDKWLYVPDRYPTFQACYELWMFIRKQKRETSRLLHRLIVRSQTRANEAFEKFGSPTLADGYTTAYRYVLSGERLTITQIAEKLNVRYHTVYNRIREAGRAPESDVSDLKLTGKKERILKGERLSITKKYLYNGNYFTTAQLADEHRLKYHNVRSIISRSGKKPGDDVSDLDFHKRINDKQHETN